MLSFSSSTRRAFNSHWTQEIFKGRIHNSECAICFSHSWIWRFTILKIYKSNYNLM